MPAEWGKTWDLLHGYSFRTGVLKGALAESRGGLVQLGKSGVGDAYGLTVDAAAAYED